MCAIGPAGIQDSWIWVASVSPPQPSRLPRPANAYASMIIAGRYGLRSAGAQGAAWVLGTQRLDARPADVRTPPEGWCTTMRSSRRPLRTLPAAE